MQKLWQGGGAYASLVSIVHLSWSELNPTSKKGKHDFVQKFKSKCDSPSGYYKSVSTRIVKSIFGFFKLRVSVGWVIKDLIGFISTTTFRMQSFFPFNDDGKWTP